MPNIIVNLITKSNICRINMSLGLQLLFIVAFIAVLLLMGTDLRRRKKKVVFLGDSITEQGSRPGGYIALIADYLRNEGLQERTKLVNKGVSGNKVDDLYFRLQDVLLQEPKVVVLFAGVNDIWHKQQGTGTSLKDFQLYYEKIIQRLVRSKVIVCTLAVIGENEASHSDDWNDLHQYGTAIKELADRYELVVCDLHQAFKNYYIQHNQYGADEGILTTDGVHLNAEGNKLVADEIWAVLRPFLVSTPASGTV